MKSLERSRVRGGWTASFWWLPCSCLSLMACSEDPKSGTLGTPSTGSVAPATDPSPSSEIEPGLVRFIDVTSDSGVAFRHHNGAAGRRHLPETMGGSAAWLDFDGDGDFDLFLGQSGSLADDPAPVADATNGLFRNLGAGEFEDVTGSAGAAIRTGFGQGVAAGDYDGDGRTDLYVTNYGANVLLKNDASATFVDVTKAAGVGDPSWSCSAAFFDKDADGDLDLYVANYVQYGLDEYKKVGDGKGYPAYPHPDNFKAARDMLYENRGDGTFLDVTVAGGIVDVDGKGLGVVPADFDRDGDLDLYVANDSTPNFTFENVGGRFVDRIESSNAGYNRDGVTEAGMGVTAGDVDGDLLPEIFVTNLDSETNTLYVNSGGMTFEDLTDLRGVAQPSLNFVGFGAAFIDLEHDGDLDLLVGNGHIIDNIETVRRGSGVTYAQRCLVHLNDGRGRFKNVVDELPAALTTRRVVRALALCDYDDDGDFDVAMGQNGSTAVLLRNDCVRVGKSLEITVADAKGKPTLGAKVEARMGEVTRLVLAPVHGSYCASGDPRFIVAGTAEVIDQLTVTWVTGEKLELKDVAWGGAIVVEPHGVVSRRPAR